MSGSSFRSVFMVASCAGAALGCYLVSLRVASERAALEKVESEIVMAQRDIRLLQTEIGTRGRLAQLERWNVRVLALSAPAADQFLEGGFALARLARPTPHNSLEAPVVLAAAPADAPKPTVPGNPQRASENADQGVSARDLLQVASLKTPPSRSNSVTADLAPLLPPAGRQTTAVIVGDAKVQTSPRTAKPVTKVAADPLAPLPAQPKPTTATAKESGKAR
ncbi:MAG TPA: hypothetical protein VFZ35_02215 [Sphingomicrobium sp.]